MEILVSPLADGKKIRVMDISWDVGDSNWQQGDWVGLYRSPPNPGTAPIFRANADRQSGSVRTGIEEGRKLEAPNYQKRCLGWWVAYWRANNANPVAVSCLGTQPRWMEENRQVIGNMRVNDMFIPGTHDSGAFILNYSPFKDNRLTKYLYTQDETIVEQLIHGARLLDLRVALVDGKFWINHGIVKTHPLEHVLEDVVKFIENTKEIVIIDVHEFPQGFKKAETHYKLIDYLKEKLGRHMVSPAVGWGVTLNHLWALDKRIIVGYNDKQIARERAGDVFWPVNQRWPNKRTLNELIEYFREVFRSFHSGGLFWSCMVQMTPSTWDVIADKLKGLRVMADGSNKDITAWFRGDWGRTTNGVSVEFIRSTGIVDAAIRWNIRRARGTSCDY